MATWLVVCEVFVLGRGRSLGQSHGLERPALRGHHHRRHSHLHQVVVVDFLWLRLLPVQLPLAVLGRGEVGSGFGGQSPLAAGGTVGGGPGGGGTRAGAPGAGGGGAGLDEVSLGCLCVFPASEHTQGSNSTRREQEHSFNPSAKHQGISCKLSDLCAV